MKFWGLQNIIRVCMAITRPDDYRPFWILILEKTIILLACAFAGENRRGEEEGQEMQKESDNQVMQITTMKMILICFSNCCKTSFSSN